MNVQKAKFGNSEHGVLAHLTLLFGEGNGNPLLSSCLGNPIERSLMGYSPWGHKRVGHEGFPHSSVGKESACNVGDPGLIPGSGRFPGEENGNSLQYSCLENPMDRGVWQATVHEVSRFRQFSD